ncbi:hypothetical protein SAMN05421824_3045 [Hyunsoonleella jejuensis]|uniref:Uncharacterized protein n=1 Tax=Hyunsoonleella jejuensis TaxID=419940 RepID=A0A1H9LHV4_9FLAO|nr:hypothetical protein SAMN05421824_3045 [Hyunsoonleella jejuensis]
MEQKKLRYRRISASNNRQEVYYIDNIKTLAYLSNIIVL